MKIPNGYSKTVNQRSPDNKNGQKVKKTKGEAIIYKTCTLHRKPRIKQHNPQLNPGVSSGIMDLEWSDPIEPGVFTYTWLKLYWKRIVHTKYNYMPNAGSLE